MIRASLLFCIYCAAIVRSLADDELSAISSLCEKKSPNDIFVDLSNMGIATINKNFVSSPAVTCLNLAGNAIKTIKPGTFDSFSKLKYLNLSMNPLNFNNFMLVSFPNLQTLVIDGLFYSDQQYLQPDLYYDNTITINHLPNLKKLSLRQSYGSFVLTWLQQLITPNLTHLYLSRNDLEHFTIPRYYVSSIQHIDLDYNRIGDFHHELLPNLRSFSMSHNELKSLCNTKCQYRDMSLRSMPQLEELYLTKNLIGNIDEDAFEFLVHLRIVDLGYNLIKNLSRFTFDYMKNLEVLKFNDNKLTKVFFMCALPNLVELRLDGNKISSSDEMSFCNLPKLAVINLSRNGLQSVSVNIFDRVPSLKELDLSWNNIKSLPDYWMGLKSTLHTLRLDGNLFEDFASMSLEHLKKLQILSIRNNTIKTITIHSILTLPNHVKISVSLSDTEILQ